MRVGLERGCLSFTEARNAAIKAHAPRFRPVLVAAMRKIVPEERMRYPRFQTGLILGPLNPYRDKVVAEVKQVGADIFANVEADFRNAWSRSLSALPAAVPGGEAGRFNDWSLEKPLATKMACMIINSSKQASPEVFASHKRVFDGFYRVNEAK